MRVLYISYTGVLEPISQNQIIPYLRGQSKKGVKYVLLSYERRIHVKKKELVKTIENAFLHDGIKWYRLVYHRYPPLLSKFYDISKGILFGLYLAWRFRIQLIHARGYVSSAVAIVIKKFFELKILFDPRGLLADEYAEYGQWSRRGLTFRIVKGMEKRLFNAADGLIVLSQRYLDVVKKEYPLFRDDGSPAIVIPCCVDTERFIFSKRERERIRNEYRLVGKTVIVYVGILGSWCLIEEMIDFFLAGKRILPDPFFLIITQSPAGIAEHALKNKGVNREDYMIQFVPPHEIPSYLSACDVGISFIKPGMSKIASSPTKVGEYLSCGLQIIINTGIGDVDDIIKQHDVGVLIGEFTNKEYLHGLDSISHMLDEKEDTRDRSRRVAEELFDLNRIGISRYMKMYENLLTQ